MNDHPNPNIDEIFNNVYFFRLLQVEMAVENSTAVLIKKLIDTPLSSLKKPLTIEQIRAEGHREIQKAFQKTQDVESLSDAVSLLDNIERGFAKVQCFLQRDVELNSQEPPKLSKIDKKYLPASVKNDTTLRNEVEELIEDARDTIAKHLIDNVQDKVVQNESLLDRFDCPNCTGSCAVQTARWSTLKFHQPSVAEDVILVPCVSETTRNIPKYTIVDFYYVSFNNFW